MKKLAAFAAYAALAAVHAGTVFAQHVALPQPNPVQIMLPMIHCATSDKGAQGSKSCESGRRSDRVIHASNVTQEELACTLSGVCGGSGRTGLQGRFDGSDGA
ncbi:MAG TPA: hypothetical protein VHB46_15900 [Burkholderiales bacterium]|nr:hypothetical protein [Burkholderiales bacterium]